MNQQFAVFSHLHGREVRILLPEINFINTGCSDHKINLALLGCLCSKFTLMLMYGRDFNLIGATAVNAINETAAVLEIILKLKQPGETREFLGRLFNHSRLTQSLSFIGINSTSTEAWQTKPGEDVVDFEHVRTSKNVAEANKLRYQKQDVRAYLHSFRRFHPNRFDPCRPTCMAQFCYHPLAGDRKQIRVLTVKPGMWDATVACQLDIVDLNGGISYEALSYVWGDNTQPGSILLHGILHTVTPNLESALRYLRYEDRPRVLWVDAVCINQNNPAERTAQVLIMGDIYTMAQTTLSWLGEASDDSDVALELIRALGDWTREHEGEIFDGEGDDPPEDGSIQTTTDAIEWLGFPLRNQNWPALWRLLERPYWTRVWIIQELAVRGRVGKASGTFICGKSQVKRTQYDYFCSLILLIMQRNNSFRLDTNQMVEPMRSMLVSGHPAGLTMAQVLAACTGGNNKNLDWLLRTTAGFRATDSRDKLYALLGLVEDGDMIEPSYTTNYTEVVKAYVLSHIERYTSLRVLLGNKYREVPSGPSWLPDLLDNGFHGGQGLIPAMDNNYFKAAGNRTAIVSSGTGSSSITCYGILVGAISQAIGPLRRVEKQFNSTHETLQARSTSLVHYEVLEAIRSYGLGLPGSRKDEFRRTLCLNGDWSEINTIFPAPASFALQSRVALRVESVPAEFMPGNSDATRFTTFTHSFAQSMTTALSNRTFIVTDNGRMGVGPYLARRGDIVAVLFGAMFCLVLRPVGQHYRLVGDAYVHGVMHGELVEELQGRDGEAFEIV